MESTKTREQLVEMAAEELQLVGSGQVLEDEDADKIDSRLDGLASELASRGVYEISDDSQIPIEAAGPLAVCLAVECATIFGVQKDYGAREDAENRLRIIVQRIQPPHDTLRVDTAISSRPAFLSYQRWLRGG